MMCETIRICPMESSTAYLTYMPQCFHRMVHQPGYQLRDLVSPLSRLPNLTNVISMQFNNIFHDEIGVP